MQIGYARISTAEQSLDLQLDALKNAGCEKIFHDVASGAKSKRPGLDDCLSQIQEGDSLVVWRIDRLGRSISHLVNTVNELKEKNIHFKSLSDGCIDTTTASGELMFNLFASLAQFERRLIQERVNAGLKSARSRGKKGGRPPLSPMDSNVITAKALHRDHKLSIAEICQKMKISKAMLYRYLKV